MKTWNLEQYWINYTAILNRSWKFLKRLLVLSVWNDWRHLTKIFSVGTLTEKVFVFIILLSIPVKFSLDKNLFVIGLLKTSSIKKIYRSQFSKWFANISLLMLWETCSLGPEMIPINLLLIETTKLIADWSNFNHFRRIF